VSTKYSLGMFVKSRSD